MKRWVLATWLVAVPIAVAAAAFWWYGNSRAEREVRQAVAQADLSDVIAYDRVTHSPLTGAVVIHNIRAIGGAAGALQPRARTLEILDWENDGGGIKALRVRLADLHLAIESAARAQVEASPQAFVVSFTDPPRDVLENPLHALVVLGYDQVTLGGEVDYRYDARAEALSLAVALDGRELGAVDLDLALVGVSQKLMLTLAAIAEKHSSGTRPNMLENLQILSQLQPELYRIGLANCGWSYVDAGLFRRFKQYHDLQTVRLPDQPSGLEMRDDDVNQAVAFATQMGFDAAVARSGAQAIAAFTRDARRLAMRTHIAEPIQIAPLLNEPGATVAAALNKLNTLLGVEFTN